MKKGTILLSVCIILLITASILTSVFVNDAVTTSNSVSLTYRPTIVIDPGHGGEDGGAITSNNIPEKNINLTISLKLRDLFQSNGFNVIMTRETDTDLSNGDDNAKRTDINNRVDIFNSSQDNIVISVHQNKFTQSQYNGTQIFYSDNVDDSKNLAECVRQSVVTLLQPDNTRLCKEVGSEIYILDNSQVPSILVECGFLSNEKEAKMLQSDEYQSELAYSIFLGFMEYYYTNYN